MRILTPLALTAAMLLALSACGDSSSSNDDDNDNNETSGNNGGSDNNGGGNASDFSPVTINSDNANDVAGMAISMLDIGLDGSNSADGARALRNPKTSLQSKAEIYSLPCEEGGTTTINAGDGDDQIETGDYVEFVENNCATEEIDDDTGESYIETSNGPTRIDVIRVTSDTDIGYKMTLDQSYSTSHGHSGSAKGSGTFNMQFDSSGNMSGDGSYNMTATYDGQSATFNPMTYTLTSDSNDNYSYGYNAEIYGSAIQGSISISTDPLFTGNYENDYPSTGTLTINGSNSSIILNADTGNNETVQMTVNDNGSISSREVTWESLEDPQPLD